MVDGTLPLIPPDEVTLLELLDRIVEKGICLRGSLTVSLADVDLLYIGLQAVVSSVARLREGQDERTTNRSPGPEHQPG